MKIYTYTVVCRAGRFPFDMLRYDRAWPADGRAIAGLEMGPCPETVEIRLNGLQEPTVARWNSFLCGVELEPVG